MKSAKTDTHPLPSAPAKTPSAPYNASPKPRSAAGDHAEVGSAQPTSRLLTPRAAPSAPAEQSFDPKNMTANAAEYLDGQGNLDAEGWLRDLTRQLDPSGRVTDFLNGRVDPADLEGHKGQLLFMEMQRQAQWLQAAVDGLSGVKQVAHQNLMNVISNIGRG